MPSNPKNKALKRVIERAEGALKGNNNVSRGAVIAAQKGWRRQPKNGGGSPIRVIEVAQ